MIEKELISNRDYVDGIYKDSHIGDEEFLKCDMLLAMAKYKDNAWWLLEDSEAAQHQLNEGTMLITEERFLKGLRQALGRQVYGSEIHAKDSKDGKEKIEKLKKELSQKKLNSIEKGKVKDGIELLNIEKNIKENMTKGLDL